MNFEEMLEADRTWAQRQHAWIAIGIKEGFASAPCCAQCDGISATINEMEEEDPPCIYTMRIYHDEFNRMECELDHPPTVWRKSDWI